MIRHYSNPYNVVATRRGYARTVAERQQFIESKESDMAGQARRMWVAVAIAVAVSGTQGCLAPKYYGPPLDHAQFQVDRKHAQAAELGYPRPGQKVIQTSYRPRPDGKGNQPPQPREYQGEPGALGPIGEDMLGHPEVGPPGVGPHPIPGELRKVSLPPYTVAPPDILVIDAVRLIPKPPYRVQALEVLLIDVKGTLPNKPILGTFTVSPEGTINLGSDYGSVRVGGLTLDQIQTAIATKLSNVLRDPQVTVALAQFRGLQQIRGQHLVRPDGTIGLGTYGAVYVAGMSLGQVKHEVEKHLSHFLLDPEISVDVFAYNSKWYYVILDGGGFGQQVIRLPITGNETVLDAISNIQGLAPVSSKKRIWLARPGPPGLGCNQILPVDWNAITQGGSTATNYQIFPGDRIYVSADRLIAIDNWLSKIITPIERILGVIFLGSSAVNSIQNSGSDVGFVAF